MPPRRRHSDKPLDPVLLLARPKEARVFEARRLDSVLFVLRGPDGTQALVPEWEVCRLAERLNLEIRGDINCRKRGAREES